MGCGASTQKKYEEATAAAPAEAAKKEKRADDDEEDEDEDDVMDDAEFEKNMAKAQTKGARMGVSAERTEVDKYWKPPVFEKTEEQEARLRKSLGKCFMFSVLDEALGEVFFIDEPDMLVCSWALKDLTQGAAEGGCQRLPGDACYCWPDGH